MNNRMIAREPVLCDRALVETITNECNCPQLVARALIRRGVLTGLYNDPTDSPIDKPLNIVIERVYSFANTHALYAGQYSLPVSPTCGTLDSRQDSARTRDTGMTITINTDPSVFPALR